MRTWIAALIACCAVAMGCETAGIGIGKGKPIMDGSRPGIVLVAFGTSKAGPRKVYDHIDAQARNRYPDHAVSWAFTSEFIRRKLKKQGVAMLSVGEALQELERQGFRSAVLQSLHVMPGQEFMELGNADKSGLRVSVGAPLLASDDDISRVVEALEPDLDPACANVIVAHGNDRFPEYNAALLRFAEKIEGRHTNAFVVSVEGQPGMDRLPAATTQARRQGKVNFVPLMIVAGDHVMNDVMGDEADSLKMQVGVPAAACSRSLGGNDEIIDIYLDHVAQALAELAAK